MEKLPIETSTSILLLLDPDSRVNCALVCKSWYNLASRSRVLYETICCHDVDTWTRRRRFFTNNPQWRNSVKTLEYKLTNRLFLNDLQELTIIYPDIQHFRLFFCEDQNDNSIRGRAYQDLRNVHGTALRKMHAYYRGAPGEVFAGWHRLTSIEETSTRMYTAFILNCSPTPFNHLTSLWLNFSHIDVYGHLGSVMEYLIKGLKNSPQLKELTLWHTRMSFDVLNVLHDRCPMIQAIALTNVSLSMDLSRKPSTTNAATHLTAFRLDSCGFRRAEIIIGYVEKKYPNLEHFVLDCGNRTGFEPSLESVVRSYITQATKLKGFYTNLFHLQPQFIKFMDDNGITELEKLRIENLGNLNISPRAESNSYNNLIAVCDNEKFKSTLKTLVIKAIQLPNGFLDRYLELKNLTTLEVDFQANRGCEQDYMYEGCYYGQEHISGPVLSLTDLFRTLMHLKKLDLRCIVTTMDEELENLHCIEEICISGSHRLYTDEFGVAYSLLDFISNNCLQIRVINLHGFTITNAPTDYQPILDLSAHKNISQITSSFNFHMHIHSRGWPVTCYQNKGVYFKKVQPEEITSNYLIIKSEHRKMFWSPKGPGKLQDMRPT